MKRIFIGILYGVGFGLGFAGIAFVAQWGLPWKKTQQLYLYDDAYIKIIDFNKANGGMKFGIAGHIENLSELHWHGVTLEGYLYKGNQVVDECMGTAYSVAAKEKVPFHIQCNNTPYDDDVELKDVAVRWVSYRPYERYFLN